MEKSSVSNLRSKIHPATDINLKPYTPDPRSKLLKVSASSILASRSANESPMNIRIVPKIANSRTKLTKKNTVAYTDWEVYKACKAPRGVNTGESIHNLRKNLKNPHIYVNGTEIDKDQKLFEAHLFNAFKQIHRD